MLSFYLNPQSPQWISNTGMYGNGPWHQSGIHIGGEHAVKLVLETTEELLNLAVGPGHP